MYTLLLFTFWGFFGVGFVEMWEWGGVLVRARGRGKGDVTTGGWGGLVGVVGMSSDTQAPLMFVFES